MREGGRYAWGFLPIRVVLLFTAAMGAPEATSSALPRNVPVVPALAGAAHALNDAHNATVMIKRLYNTNNPPASV